ncbi:SDR family NAD(P)-dependent oxidoreductase [Francisella frigiditurris]|uniref:Short chain dehydrogenase family protein n=1 Tax=Francisella frigiditurris TaxID=1542390 RepID=A0A1J0KVM9_9GAMM|nr:SDR family oxidoreductase [Francisella frigiditurris]APC97809.1 short chain dehydrogenase family protein [Francisella frigiditurris]
MKNYIISGGSTGIGREVIKELSQKGYKIINLDINPPAEMLKNEDYIEVDLSNYKMIDKYIPLDRNYEGIFLNVGIHRAGSIFTQTLEEIEKLINTNLLSNISIIKALENNLNKGASIVFNGSDQCFVGKYNSFAYGLTKGAIAQITKSLALDLSSQGIRVNTVCPGTTDTPLYRQAIDKYSKESRIPLEIVEKEEATEFPIGRIANAKEIAKVVLFLLSDDSSYMTGSLIPVDGGYTAK